MEGLPHSMCFFPLYLSVTVNSVCAPSQNLYAWKKSKPPCMSSKTAYCTPSKSSVSDMSNKPPKYTWLPRDRAHRVFPNRVAPCNTRDLRRPRYRQHTATERWGPLADGRPKRSVGRGGGLRRARDTAPPKLLAKVLNLQPRAAPTPL